MLDEINDKLPGIMELDLEGFFKRGIWVSKRSGKEGAKKKYALLDEKGKMKVRGFESVRRDWCLLSREVQNKVLSMVLEDGNDLRAVRYVKGVIKKLKNREVELDKLIIKTGLKRPVNDYKSMGPHVLIAKRMEKLGMPVNVGMLVEYFIAEDVNGKKRSLVRDRAKLPSEKGEYDINYNDSAMSLRPQAHDIIRTWLFYTVVKSVFHFGRVPWKRVMISGHAQDPQGRSPGHLRSQSGPVRAR